MTPIHVSMDVRLNPGYSEYAIDSERDLELTFRADQFCRDKAQYLYGIERGRCQRAFLKCFPGQYQEELPHAGG